MSEPWGEGMTNLLDKLNELSNQSCQCCCYCSSREESRKSRVEKYGHMTLGDITKYYGRNCLAAEVFYITEEERKPIVCKDCNFCE